MKKFISRIFRFFRLLLGRQFDFVKMNSEIAVEVTKKLKEIIENPFATFVADLIPGNVDNEILYKLQKIFPTLYERMVYANRIVSSSQTNHDLLASIITHLREQMPSQRVSFWLEFSGALNEALNDGKISFAEAVSLAQLVYAEKKKP